MPTPPKRKRESIDKRAGTKLNHQYTREVHGTVKGTKRMMGLIDTASGVYQIGGEYSNFLFRRLGVLSIPFDTWEEIRDTLGDKDNIEFVDHDRNICYRIAIDKADDVLCAYDAGIGQRAGIPVDSFEKYDQDDTLIS